MPKGYAGRDQDIRVNMRISSDISEAAKALAAKRNISMSQLVRELLVKEIEEERKNSQK